MSTHDVKFPFTKLPNTIIDDHLNDLNGSDIFILLIVCRKTFGFQKLEDRIAISTFVEISGLSKSTVIETLKKLEDINILSRDRATTPHTYTLSKEIVPKEKVDKVDVRKINPGSKTVPEMVENSNRKQVGKFNPQKNTSKQNERNTTTNSISEEEYLKICNYWNAIFGNTLDPENQGIKNQIFEVMAQFSVNQLKKAMFYRSKSDFYRKKVPYLRNKPESFFGYSDTIANDLQRKPENLFTYPEMVNKVTTENLDMDRDFQKIEDFQINGEKLWEYKNQDA